MQYRSISYLWLAALSLLLAGCSSDCHCPKCPDTTVVTPAPPSTIVTPGY